MLLTMTLPLQRRSPLVVPRRDVVLAAAETVVLQVTLVTEDKPTAAPLDLSGLGPKLTWQLWRRAQVCDYGWTPFGTSLTWTAEATFPNAAAGRADLTIPSGALPAGTAWHTLMLEYSGALTAVACGAVQVLPGPSVGETIDFLTDENDNVLEV